MERGTKLTAQPSNAGEPPVRRKLQDGVLYVNEHENTNDDSYNWRSEDNYGELAACELALGGGEVSIR
jgi:hypothetical protein